jgi:hypothetical protein
MLKEDYIEELENDIREVIYIEFEEDELKKMRESDFREKIELLDSYNRDDITGNASGSYTFNSWQAEENICHMWNEIQDMIDNFKYGAEGIDVALRCYFLDEALENVISEMESEYDW